VADIEKGIKRLIFSDKLFNFLIFERVHSLHGMADDKAIMGGHNREENVFVFGNSGGLDNIVIDFLAVLTVELDPTGIPATHGIAVIGMNVDWAG